MESSESFNESMEERTSASGNLPIYLVPVQWDWRLILQLILAIVGILGNALVIHVYLNTNTKFTKSVTNRFIAALAVADMITSICHIPIPTLSRIPDNFGGLFYCKIVINAFVMWVSIVASVFSLTTLAIERYVAIAHPIRYKKIFTVKTTRLIIVMIWISAFVFNSFIIYCNHLRNGVCYVDFGSVAFQRFIGASAFIVEYLVPIIVMLVTNVQSIRLLKVRSRSFTETPLETKSPNLALLRARQRVINMVFTVIITFIICWSPDQFAFLAFNTGLVPVRYLDGIMYRAFVILAFANSCLNPLLYALTNKNFRRAIKQHLFRIKKRSNESINGLFDTPLDASDSKSADGAMRNILDVPFTSQNNNIASHI